MNLCPHCKAPFSRIHINAIKAVNQAGVSWDAISYSCPSCGVSLAVSIDPVMLHSQTTDAITAAIRKLK